MLFAVYSKPLLIFKVKLCSAFYNGRFIQLYVCCEAMLILNSLILAVCDAVMW